MDTQEVHHEIDLGPRTAQKEWQASEARNCKPAYRQPNRVRRTRRIHSEFALKVKEPRHEAGAWSAFGGKADMTFCDAHVCF